MLGLATHLVVPINGCARTRCGTFAPSERKTQKPEEVDCVRCRRSMKKDKREATMAAKLPPIELERLYTTPEKTGIFTLRAKPLPADVFARMTDAENMARQDAEKKAIAAEWERLKQRG